MLITLQMGQERIIVRGSKDFRVEIDEKMGIVLNSDNYFLFDAESQQRMKF